MAQRPARRVCARDPWHGDRPAKPVHETRASRVGCPGHVRRPNTRLLVARQCLAGSIELVFLSADCSGSIVG
jgi:hypothetical protein